MQVWTASPKLDTFEVTLLQVMLGHGLTCTNACLSSQKGPLWCLCRSLESAHKWAAEAAQNGTFSSVLADEQAASNIGGLPVPALCIGTRRDLITGAHLSFIITHVRHHTGKPVMGESIGLWLSPLLGCIHALLKFGSLFLRM